MNQLEELHTIDSELIIKSLNEEQVKYQKSRMRKYLSLSIAVFNNLSIINIMTFIKFFKGVLIHLRYLGTIGIGAEFLSLIFKIYKISQSNLPRYIKII